MRNPFRKRQTSVVLQTFSVEIDGRVNTYPKGMVIRSDDPAWKYRQLPVAPPALFLAEQMRQERALAAAGSGA